MFGQDIIGGRSTKNSINRVDHYNKYNLLRDRNGDDISNNFVRYRDNWHKQPTRAVESYQNSGLLPIDITPLSLDLELAAVCDLACPYCYRQTYVTPDKIMKYDLAINLIDQAVKLGIPSIKFNWRGEPLLHPKLVDIIRYAKRQGIIDTIINTNATQLSPEISEQLIRSGLDYIIFSFDGGTRETYEKNRVGRFRVNSFDSIVNNIKAFSRIKDSLGSHFPYTRVQMVLTPEAQHEQTAYIQLFDDYLDEVVVNNYHERGQGQDLLNHSDRLIYNQKTSDFNLPNNAHYLKTSDGSLFVSTNRRPCDQIFQRMLITYDGRVSMCCFDWGAMHPVGFVSNQCFHDYNYDKYKVLELASNQVPGFELMPNVKLPPQLNSPELTVQSLEEIWFGVEMNNIRQAHAIGDLTSYPMCESCSYRSSHVWK